MAPPVWYLEKAGDPDPLFDHYPVLTAVTIEQGDLVSITAAGYARRLTGATDTVFGGIAEETVINAGASGSKRIKCRRKARVYQSAAVGTYTIADHGATVYAGDHTGAFTNTATNAIDVGRLGGQDANGKWFVELEADSARSL